MHSHDGSHLSNTRIENNKDGRQVRLAYRIGTYTEREVKWSLNVLEGSPF